MNKYHNILTFLSISIVIFIILCSFTHVYGKTLQNNVYKNNEIKYSVFEEHKSINENIYKTSFKKNISRQVVILKADDLGMEKTFKYWDKFFDYIIDKKIKTSVGIIGKPLSKKTDNYLEKIKIISEKNADRIEFWNHGWSHWGPETGLEFRGPSLEKQIRSLSKTNQFVRDKLGISLITFGAGNNRFDENTTQALEENPDIKINFNYLPVDNPKTSLFNLNFSEIIGYDWPEVISFKRFLDVYTKDLKDSSYIVLQIHPASPWDTDSWKEFDKIIEYLKSRNVEFMTPSQYFEHIAISSKI